MQDAVYSLFVQYGDFAFFLSILLNIIISVLAFIPTVFLTAVNLLFFGFWKGTLVSFIGESIGAIISFYLYRKGFKKFTNNFSNRFVKKILEAEGLRAFFLVLFLRFIPFLPSSLITIAASLGSISLVSFSISSTLGKMISILIESYSIYHLISIKFHPSIVIILFIFVFPIFYFYKKYKKAN